MCLMVKVTGRSDGLDMKGMGTWGGYLEQRIDVILPFTSGEILQYNKMF